MADNEGIPIVFLPGHPVEAAVLGDLLLLVDVSVPTADIEGWSYTQRVFAENWVYACHLSASDNVLNDFCRAHDEDADYDLPFRCICRPPKPDFLNSYPKPEPFPMLKREGTARIG